VVERAIGEGAKRAAADCAGPVVGRSRSSEAAEKGVEGGAEFGSGYSFDCGFELGEVGLLMTAVRCMSGVFGGRGAGALRRMRAAGERWIRGRGVGHQCDLVVVMGVREVVFGPCFGCALRND
jgi:hypothetical protein